MQNSPRPWMKMILIGDLIESWDIWYRNGASITGNRKIKGIIIMLWTILDTGTIVPWNRWPKSSHGILRVPCMEIGFPQGRMVILWIRFNEYIFIQRRLITQRRNHLSPIKTSCRPIRAMAITRIINIVDVVVIGPSLSLITRKKQLIDLCNNQT